MSSSCITQHDTSASNIIKTFIIHLVVLIEIINRVYVNLGGYLLAMRLNVLVLLLASSKSVMVDRLPCRVITGIEVVTVEKHTVTV